MPIPKPPPCLVVLLHPCLLAEIPLWRTQQPLAGLSFASHARQICSTPGYTAPPQPPSQPPTHNQADSSRLHPSPISLCRSPMAGLAALPTDPRASLGAQQHHGSPATSVETPEAATWLLASSHTCVPSAPHHPTSSWRLSSTAIHGPAQPRSWPRSPSDGELQRAIDPSGSPDSSPSSPALFAVPALAPPP